MISSYIIQSCTPTDDDTIRVDIDVYSSDDCTPGATQLAGKSFNLPSSCVNGTQISCQVSDQHPHGTREKTLYTSLSFCFIVF